MLILTIRTDKPEAELGLFQDTAQVDYVTWQAHRELGNTIHATINTLLKNHSQKLNDIQGIVCYKGPGSFTGLRIGLAVGNALADSLHIPIVSANTADWQAAGIGRLLEGQTEQVAVPEYGAEAFVTQPKK